MATPTSARKPAAKSKNTNQKSAGNRSVSVMKPSDTGAMLEKYIIDSLKDIYWAEKHLLKALPKMSKAATNEVLKDALDEHRDITEQHVSRLEQVFDLMGKKAQGKKCEAMEGLVKEGETVIEETDKGTATRDVGIIMAAQKVEHYEIATYGGLVQLTRTMGYDEVADLLAETLAEEKDADVHLTSIAENDINLQAEFETEE